MLWGALHGLFLVAENGIRRRFPDWQLPRPAARLLTLALVCFAWVFFRAGSIPEGMQLLAQLPVGWSFAAVADCLRALGGTTLAQLALGGLCLALLPERGSWDGSRTLALFWLTVATVTAWGMGLTAGAGNAFLYFQF